MGVKERRLRDSKKIQEIGAARDRLENRRESPEGPKTKLPFGKKVVWVAARAQFLEECDPRRGEMKCLQAYENSQEFNQVAHEGNTLGENGFGGLGEKTNMGTVCCRQMH